MNKAIPTTHLPRHVAVVMDGNGRWAKQRQLPRTAGHKAAIKSVRALVERAAELQIPVLTVFAFSSENWQRPKAEISLLMRLFVESLNKEVDELDAKGVRLRFIGNLAGLAPKLQKAMQAAMQRTQYNKGLTFCIAVNYGGQWDIVQAARKLAKRVQSGELAPDDIDMPLLDSQLTTAGLPAVDLFIRSSGEQRLSNFLLWQSAYAELYFPDVLFPDFDKRAFDQALQWFAGRERRFGKISEQLKS